MRAIFITFFAAISMVVFGQQEYKLVAHRGGVVNETIGEYDPRSCEQAIEREYWMVEIDIRPTADSAIVLLHDNNYLPTFGVNVAPEKMTLSQIKSLRAMDGGFEPMTLKELAQMCSHKIRVMLDIKYDGAQQWFYDSVSSILRRYDLLDSMFVLDKKHEKFLSVGKFGFRQQELPAMKERMKNGEDIARRYYMFDHGNRLNAESILWCRANGIEVCASINFFHYRDETYQKGVERDVDYLKKAGVTIFQIDSHFDTFF